MTTNKKLEEEFRFYIQNQDELLENYIGKFLVIKDQKVIGSYDSSTEAYTETLKEHEIGSFLIQFCSPGDNSYSQTFFSRVSFQ